MGVGRSRHGPLRGVGGPLAGMVPTQTAAAMVLAGLTLIATVNLLRMRAAG